MALPHKSYGELRYRFWLGMAGVFALSFSLRFWELNRFNTLVFDEVYFAQFANNYLTGTLFEDGHPPLGKYLIAIGIWIGNHVSVADPSTANSLTGSLLTPLSYRWMNALAGSFIPLVAAGIAYQLSHRRGYAFLAGLLVAADGLLLVESRYALINVYLILFGLLGQWLFLVALTKQPRERGIWLALAGASLGAAVAVKWNGLGFLLGIYLLWSLAWGFHWLKKVLSRPRTDPNALPVPVSSPPESDRPQSSRVSSPLSNLRQLGLLHIVFDLGLIPALVYRLAWIPHLQLDRETSFWAAQKALLSYHAQIGNIPNAHPYCSAWYSWPWLLRPVAYYHQAFRDTTSATALASPTGYQELVYDVHGLGNPILWWLAALAILWLLGSWGREIWLKIATVGEIPSGASQPFWVVTYLLVNYAANFLPWASVTRCTFVYHYMAASIFGFLAIAWLIHQWLHSHQLWLQSVGITLTFSILWAFVFWLPLYLGLPLSPEAFHSRIWLASWM